MGWMLNDCLSHSISPLAFYSIECKIRLLLQLSIYVIRHRDSYLSHIMALNHSALPT